MKLTARRPSRTAVLTAVARALHREEPPPWVLDDPLAMGLAGDDGPAVARRFRTELRTESLLSFTRWVCVRARLPEDIVEKAVEQGVEQYVILGAGLDSFAYRRSDLVSHLRVYEVDHPASQAWKRQRSGARFCNPHVRDRGGRAVLEPVHSQGDRGAAEGDRVRRHHALRSRRGGPHLFSGANRRPLRRRPASGRGDGGSEPVDAQV